MENEWQSIADALTKIPFNVPVTHHWFIDPSITKLTVVDSLHHLHQLKLNPYLDWVAKQCLVHYPSENIWYAAPRVPVPELIAMTQTPVNRQLCIRLHLWEDNTPKEYILQVMDFVRSRENKNCHLHLDTDTKKSQFPIM